jgi:hypothetical protein
MQSLNWEKSTALAGVLAILLYLNCTCWSITTMPSIFEGEVIDEEWVRGIFAG